MYLRFCLWFYCNSSSLPVKGAGQRRGGDSKKAYITNKVSDLTGETAPEGAFASLIVREHPNLDRAVTLDVLPSEIDGLKAAGEYVVIELRAPGEANGGRQLVVSLDDFNALSPDMAAVLSRARGLRGRRPKVG